MVTTIFGLFGGLAIFLYGMNNMSESLQKAAGERMKKILSFLTRNPLMGALAGALVTAVLQSSSATTVMVIGFVSAGMMGLPQAISVIFGANIGTTMTAQLIAFDISEYIMPIIALGFLVSFVAKNEKIKNVASVFFYFGLLFEGIQLMSSVMKPLASSPVFTQLMEQVKDIPVLGVVLGTVMTLVVQSSSATIAVLQSFASQPMADGVTSVMGLTGAIPILLGDNIGTTITALLASIGQSRNAKRTAIAHSIFNISGAVLFGFLIIPFAHLVQLVSTKGPEIQVISRQIANAHTIFNITMTLIWLPAIPLMVAIVRKLVPHSVAEAREQLLDRRLITRPVAALMLVDQEIRKCSSTVSKQLHMLSNELMMQGKMNTVERRTMERTYDQLSQALQSDQQDITNYLTQMFSQGSMSQVQSEQGASYMSVITDLQRISERCDDIINQLRKAREHKWLFSEDANQELTSCFAILHKLYDRTLNLMDGEEKMTPYQLYKAKNKLRKSIKNFSKSHLVRVEAGVCSEEMTPIYTQVLYCVDRISDNCVSIAEEEIDQINNEA